MTRWYVFVVCCLWLHAGWASLPVDINCKDPEKIYGSMLPEIIIALEHRPRHEVEKLLHYGCYCGLGGQGTPLDATDTCCQKHDECYENMLEQSKRNFFHFLPLYVKVYHYKCLPEKDSVTCESEQDPQAEKKCECDKTLGLCLRSARLTYNSTLENHDRKTC